MRSPQEEGREAEEGHVTKEANLGVIYYSYWKLGLRCGNHLKKSQREPTS